MEKEIVITKRFRNHTHRTYQYLLKKFSYKTAVLFLERIEKRIEFVSKYPAIGKKSLKKENVRSVLLTPYSLIFYRIKKNHIEILSLFDMRQNPEKKTY